MTNKLEKSWVELFSNKSFVQNANKGSLTNIFLGAKFPGEIFFSLIHEATHHWSFTSYIGNSLFVIKMRAYLAAIQQLKVVKAANTSDGPFSDDDLDVNWNIYSHYRRFTVVQQALKPVSEGLALFAELDSFPSDTEAIPTYLVYISMVFSGVPRDQFEGKEVAEFELLYKEFLLQKRLATEEAVERKMNLLVESTSPEITPYLIGYLFIKNVQAVLVKANTRFSDPNLFIQFIRYWYFNDMGLVDILFDEAIIDEKIAPKIIQRFFDRTQQLNTVNADDLADFEKNLLSPEDYTNLLEMKVSPQTVKLAGEKFSNAYKKMVNANADAQLMMTMRNFFCITQLNCYLIITQKRILVEVRLPAMDVISDDMQKMLDHGYAFIRGNYIDIITGSFPNELHFPDFDGPALFEKYITFYTPPLTFSVFTSDGKLIYYDFDGDDKWEGNAKKAVIEYFTIPKFPSEEGMEKQIFEVLKRDQSAFDIIEHSQTRHFNSLYEYIDGISVNCIDTKYSAISAIMKRNGFWEVLNEREDLLKLFAFLSLLCSNRFISFESVSDIFPDTNLIYELHDILNEAGFRIFEIAGDEIGMTGI